jgi:2'-5' RNA ligase
VAPEVAWVARDNVHLTLKFLGAVEAARLEAVAGALAAAAARAAPFDLGLDGLGGFPSSRRPRVIWAGLGEGVAATAALAREVDVALAGLGFPREPREFSAHVTLGRVRVPRSNRPLADALTGSGELGRQRVEHVVLMRSDLSPRGARYTELVAAPLGAGAPG